MTAPGMTAGPWHWATDPQGSESLLLRGADGQPINFEARVAAEGLPALLEAARAVLRRNVIDIYDSSQRPLYPDFVAVTREAFEALRAAVAACEGGTE